MPVSRRDSNYGTPVIFKNISFFDILKKQILKVEEIALRPMCSSYERAIGFQTIPFRN